MAIALDTAVSQRVSSGTNTVPMTIGASANYLVVHVVVLSGTVSVTWNGVSMTQVGVTATSAANGYKSYSYYLAAPATGTHNIVATQSGSTTLYVMGISYSGVAQTAPEAAVASNPSGGATSLVQTITTLTANAWTTCSSTNDQQPPNLTASTNSTLRGSVMDNSVGAFDSNGPIASPGSFSMTQTGGSSVNRMGIILSLAPLASTASAPDLRLAFL